MGEFKPDWLALREAADVGARSSRLTRLVAGRFPDDAVLHVLDVATGTGANMRYLAEHLPPQQSWVLVDRDSVLLSELSVCTHSWGAARGLTVTSEGDALLLSGERLMCRLATRRRDLGAVIDDRAADIFAGCAFVTASALQIDLGVGRERCGTASCRLGRHAREAPPDEKVFDRGGWKAVAAGDDLA